MSHVKRVKKDQKDGSLRVLICTKWEYETCLSEDLKKQVSELATRTLPSKHTDADKAPLETPADTLQGEQSSLDTVWLPDRLVYIREIYDRLRQAAGEWPIVFNTQPPSF